MHAAPPWQLVHTTTPSPQPLASQICGDSLAMDLSRRAQRTKYRPSPAHSHHRIQLQFCIATQNTARCFHARAKTVDFPCNQRTPCRSRAPIYPYLERHRPDAQRISTKHSCPKRRSGSPGSPPQAKDATGITLVVSATQGPLVALGRESSDASRRNAVP